LVTLLNDVIGNYKSNVCSDNPSIKLLWTRAPKSQDDGTSSFFIFLSMATRSTTSMLLATVLKLFWDVLSQSEKVQKMPWASSIQDTSSWSCLMVSYGSSRE